LAKSIFGFSITVPMPAVSMRRLCNAAIFCKCMTS